MNMDQENSPHKKRVTWDEEKIKETQKTRGTFQKIDEPKTPYRANSDEEEGDMQNENKTEEEIEVDLSLRKAQQNREINKRGKIDLATLNAKLKEEMAKYHDSEPMEQEETEEQIKKRQQFKKKRAAHYNEFAMIQKAQQNDWQSDSD